MDPEITTAIVPRTNARALAFEQLSAEQRQACMRTLRLLVGMADECDLHPSTLASGDAHAAFGNRVVLLDGGRGSGKTTILLTVLDLLRRSRDPQANVPAVKLDAPYQSVRLIPLDVLDLHTLPKGPSILQHIASRIAAVARLHGGDCSSWRTPQPAQDGLQRSLDRFVQAIGQGWELDPLARSGLGDPETITHQTRSAADAWRQVDDLFDRVVRAVCDQFVARSSTPTKPLLVLPIDDADMNPERSIELLGIMRALNHPHFAYLLTGHTDLFLEQLRIWFLGRIRQPLAAVRFHPDERKPVPQTSLAPTLGFDYFDRVIPPDHRCSVPEIEGIARWSVLRTVLASSKTASGLVDDGVLRKLDRALDNDFLVRALPSRRRALENLGRLITRDIEEREAAERPKSSSATAERKPKSTPRTQSLGLSADERVGVVAHRLWRDALYRGAVFQSGALNPEALFDVVKLRGDDDNKLDSSLSLRVETRALHLRYAYWEQPLLSIEAFSTPVVFADAVVLRPWSVRARLVDDAFALQAHEFSDAVSASYQFAADAARSLKRARSDGDSSYEPPIDAPPALIRTRIRLREVAEPVAVNWQLLDFERYSDAYRFGTSFRRGLEKRGQTSLAQAAKLVLKYAASERAQDEGDEQDSAAEAFVPQVLELPSWSELFSPFVEEAEGFAKLVSAFVTGREVALDVSSFRSLAQRLGAKVGRVGLSWALFHLPLFASPEFGMPVAEAAELLSVLRQAWVGLPMGPERSFWDQVCEVLVEERRTLLRRAFREQLAPGRAPAKTDSEPLSTNNDPAQADLARIEQQYFSGQQEPHPWFREVERSQRADRTGAALKTFSAQLGRYFFDRSEFSRGPALTNLSQFVEQLQSRTRQLRMAIGSVPVLLAPVLQVLDDAPLSAEGGRMLSDRSSLLSQAVYEGWTALSRDARPSDRYVSFRSDGRVSFALDVEREEFERQSIDGATVRSFARSIVSTVDNRQPAADLSFGHDLYFRLCRDLSSEGFVSARLPEPEPRGGALFEREILGVRAAWRDVPWPSLFDCELFDEYWRTVIGETLGITGPKIPDAERVDVLAFAFLLGTAHVAMRRKQPIQTRWEARPRAEAWRRTVDSIFVDPTPARERPHPDADLLARWRNAARGQVFERWQQSALLIAAPESGVSPAASQMILQAYFGVLPLSSELAIRERKRLFDLRIAQQEIEGTKARASLAAFDADPRWNQHPWFDYIGRVEPQPKKKSPSGETP